MDQAGVAQKKFTVADSEGVTTKIIIEEKERVGASYQIETPHDIALHTHSRKGFMISAGTTPTPSLLCWGVGKAHATACTCRPTALHISL